MWRHGRKAMRVCSELRRDNKTVGVQIERWNEYVRKSRRSVGVSIACASCLSMHVASCKSIEDDDKKDRKKEVDEAEKADVFIQGIKDQVQQALSKALHSDAFLHFQSKVNECITFDTDRQLSYGFIMGFCSGIALKKMSKAGAVALGAVFILLQSIAYAGYIHVNYEKLEHDLMSVLDLNKDGRVDGKDMQALYQTLLETLEFNLPAGGGFAIGFALGFRYG